MKGLYGGIAMPNKFFRKTDERGQSLTEYALILVLIAIVAVAAVTLLGGQISVIFNDIVTALGG